MLETGSTPQQKNSFTIIPPSPVSSPTPYEFINKSHLLFGRMTNIVIRLRRRQRCIVGYLSVNKAALPHYFPASEKWEIIQRFKDFYWSHCHFTRQ